MTTVAQATYMGNEIIVECDGRWDCCQREQAKHKVRQMNANLPGNGIQSRVTRAMNRAKAKAQDTAAARLDALTAREQAEEAEAAGAAPCLVKKMREGGTRKSMGLQMDHPLDVKLGGVVSPPTMTPLDAAVNNAMGGLAKNTGNRMANQGATAVEKVTLICPPSYPGCPNENHSEGERTEFPTHWWKTQFVRMRGMGSFLVL
jgi:hypothetical protein